LRHGRATTSFESRVQRSVELREPLEACQVDASTDVCQTRRSVRSDSEGMETIRQHRGTLNECDNDSPGIALEPRLEEIFTACSMVAVRAATRGTRS
jgi:hypothetical protein